jgi:hypothetical protein
VSWSSILGRPLVVPRRAPWSGSGFMFQWPPLRPYLGGDFAPTLDVDRGATVRQHRGAIRRMLGRRRHWPDFLPVAGLAGEVVIASSSARETGLGVCRSGGSIR